MRRSMTAPRLVCPAHDDRTRSSCRRVNVPVVDYPGISAGVPCTHKARPRGHEQYAYDDAKTPNGGNFGDRNSAAPVDKRYIIGGQRMQHQLDTDESENDAQAHG